MVDLILSSEFLFTIAQSIGFDLVGISKYKVLVKEKKYLESWLNKGFNGEMKYLEKNIDKREDVRNILNSCNSVISIGLNYFTGHKHSDSNEKLKISRYAWGKDYHYVMWEKLDKLIKEIKNKYPNFEAIRYVDTGPVMDKVWAVNSGLGWMGKNTNIINKNIGSWFFIGNILCNAEFSNYNSKSVNFCGTCTKCIDNCPTAALLGNYEIDASKCISYLNIENKGKIPYEFKNKFNNWILGCDICQEVCPWNIKFSALTKEINFIEGNNVEFIEEDFNKLTSEEFNKKFKESPILRPKLKGILRNINFLKKT